MKKRMIRKSVVVLLATLCLLMISLLYCANTAMQEKTLIRKEQIVGRSQKACGSPCYHDPVADECEETIMEEEPDEEEIVVNRSGDTTAYGTITWQDDFTDPGGIHPVRMVKVELYDADTSGGSSFLLGTTFTDHQGNYEISFNNDMSSPENGYDLYLRIYAGDNNTYVMHNTGTNKYYYDMLDKGYGIVNNVSTGVRIEVGPLAISMNSN